MKKQEILKNQLIRKAQQYFINIASIFEQAAQAQSRHFRGELAELSNKSDAKLRRLNVKNLLLLRRSSSK